MPAATPPDYAQQLHDAIQATRDTLLTAGTTADAAAQTALGALDVSRRTFSDARLALGDAFASQTVAAYLDRRLVDANLTATNVISLATGSNARASAATSAVAVAATSIKAAAEAIDAVNRDVGGVASITKTKDSDDEINKVARDAVQAVQEVARAVEELKTFALIANVEAARPSTAAALQAAQTSQKSVAGILGSANTALAASNDAVTAAQAARTADLDDLFVKSVQFTLSADDDAALHDALVIVDGVSNASLRVSVKNAKNKDGVEAPGLSATCDFPAELHDTTREVRFFAVPQQDGASFDFQAAVANKHFKVAETAKSPKTIVEYHALLRNDSNGDELQYGLAYSVFFLRIPKTAGSAATKGKAAGEAHAAHELPPRATDFSFPTAPITSTVLLTFQGAPVVFRLAGGAFVTVFEGTDHQDKVGSYHLFTAPADVYEKQPGAELLIANRLDAASYTSIPPDHTCTQPSGVMPVLKREFRQDVGTTNPLSAAAVDSLFEALEDWLKKARTSFYLVYFSPFSTKEGWQTKGKFTIARYTDMYGDLMDLEHRGYYALVLAEGFKNRQQVQEAANVLSEPSLFVGTNPIPLPAAAEPPKPAKK